MNYRVVLDTSTLILLARIDLLPILTERTGVLIPAEVEREAMARPQSYDAKLISSTVAAGKVKVTDEVGPDRFKRIAADFGLDAGEAAALALAKKRGLPLGTDDGPAIKASKIMEVPFFTAVHVLLELYGKRRIAGDEALAKLHVLEKIARYSVQILEDARKQIKEKR